MDSYTFNGFTFYGNIGTEIEQSLPDTMRIGASPSTESILFRILLGTLDFKHHQFEELFSQKICYSKITDVFVDRTVDNPIGIWLNNEFGIGDLEWYFKKNRRNKALFDELLTEFILYFFNKKRNNHTSAFLHLYRALEFMSYSFPISYSSRVVGFYTSFDTFKDFFVNKEQGQLKFFREFVSSLFEKSLLICRTTIDTYVGEELYDKQKIKIIQKLCKEFDHHDNGSLIQIEYKYLLDFMITLRNRYFHFQYDRGDNISNINFDSELFFEALNDKFANWLSMIYLEILTQGVYKFNLMPI
ncbi:MAG TPA: hypothetical protein PLP23_13990 [Panacibacter sp.]|nr:hypothetical protein [Panacibacter sp.]